MAHTDIRTLEVDAIVVPCTSMGALVDPLGSLLTEAGATLVNELKAKSPLAVGAAILGNPAPFAAKAAIMVPIKKHLDDEAVTEHIRRAIRAALVAANIKKFTTLALPSMIQRGGKTTVSDASRAVVQEINGMSQEFPQRIYMVDTNQDMIFVFEDAIQNAQHAI